MTDRTKPDETELRQWCVDAAIRTVESVLKALPQNPGTTNNVNIDVVSEATRIHAFITGGGS
jgi:hypothetical protein